MASKASKASTPRFSGWRIAALASFIHNCSYGLAFGAYGVSVLAIQDRFDTTRATVSIPLSLITAAIVLSAPVLGMLYGRISIRRSIILGAVLGAAGHFCLAATHDWRIMLACYALLVGPGVALAGSMPTNVLVTKWFVARRGLALGIVNLPLGLMLVPLISVVVLQHFGLTTLYITTGLIFLLIIPAAWILADRPEQVGQAPLGDDGVALSKPDGSAAPTISIAAILTRFEFWALVTAIGIIVGGSSMKYAHMVPLLGEQGHSIEQATMLLSIAGGAGAIGSLLFGWLADRFGGARMIVITAFLQACMWFIFLLPVNIPLLTADAIIIGMCGGGVTAAQGVYICQRFGQANFSRVLGLLALALFPFFTGINPLAGYLRDVTGDYRMAVHSLIVASAFAAVLLTLVTTWKRQPRIGADGARAHPPM